MTLKVILCALMVTSCTLGPVEITHEDGSLPKVHLNIIDECKVRLKPEAAVASCETEF